MAEGICIAIALICAVADANGASLFFLACGVGVSVWRRSKLAEEFRNSSELMRREIDSLHADLAAVRALVGKTTAVERNGTQAAASVAASQVIAATIPAPQARAPEPIVKPPEPARKVPEPAPAAVRLDTDAATAASATSASVGSQAGLPLPSVARTTVSTAASPTAPTPPPQVPIPSKPLASAQPTRPPATTPAPVFQSAVQPTLQQRMRSALDLEEVLGTNWLNKIGVTILVLGIALFGIYELGSLGPLGKVALSLAVSIGLLGAGIYLERRERFVVIGRAAIGGGWALLFFCTYAINHIAAMQVLRSETIDCILMLGVAVGMAAHTLRYRSQVVTGMAFLLAYSTVALSHDNVYSLVAGVVLAIGLVAIVVRLSWFELEVFGILASYLNHLYWLYRILGPGGANGKPFSEFVPSTSLLLFYWAIFRVSYVMRKVRWPEQENVSTIAALLNSVLLLSVMKFQSSRPQLAFYALLALGAMEFCIGQLGMLKRRRKPFVLLSIVGAVLMFAAIPFRYSGNNIAVIWLAGAEAFLIAGILFRESLFRRMGLIAGLIVGVQALTVDVISVSKARMTAEAPLITTGVLLGAAALIFYINACIVGKWWKLLFETSFDSALIRTHSYVGAAAVAVACWAALVFDWTAVAFAGVMIVLAAVGQYIKSRDLQVQYGSLALIAVGRAVMVNLHFEVAGGSHLKARLITLPVIAALMYLAAPLAKQSDSLEQRNFRGIFAFLGSMLAALLIYFEVPTGWQPLAFAIFAMLLMEVGRALDYRVLSWHAHLLAALALGFGFALDFGAHGRHTGLLECVPVIAAMYILALRTRMDEGRHEHSARVLYTWAASAFAAWVLSLAVPPMWISVAWILFGLVLIGAQRVINFEHLDWQSYAVSALACIRAGMIDLHEAQSIGHVSGRLLTVSVVIAGAYGVAQLLHSRQEQHGRDLRLHSWAGCALAVFLMWYELQPISVAVGWALVGLVLFQYGAWQRILPYRLQAYLVLAAAFTRIFFLNLTAESAARFVGPRMYTVVPIAIILYYVYSQVSDSGETEADAKRLHMDVLLGYLATGTVAALLYFQFAGDWVVTAWAVVVAMLLGVALVFKKQLFVQQAMLLTACALGRAMFHNLFGASYFNGTDWKGRFVVLGSAVAVMLLCLPLAFELRRRLSSLNSGTQFTRVLMAVSRRPEQVMFFVPVVLLTTMLALKMDHGFVTAAWGVEGVLIFILALLVKERSFRLTGLGILLLCVGKIIVVDAWHLAPRDRYVTFIVLGASLLAVSFLYSKYRETIREYL